MRRIWVPQLVAALMLLWGLNPENPYGYYILLRWVCCGIFAYLGLQGVRARASRLGLGSRDHGRRVQPDPPSTSDEGDLVGGQRRYNRYRGGVGLCPQAQG